MFKSPPVAGDFDNLPQTRSKLAQTASRPPSIADVAARAQVSKATVSLVLNRKSKEMAISEATRRRVLEAARQIDYRPPVPRVYQRHVRSMVRHISIVLVTELGIYDHEFLAPACYEIMRAAGNEGLLVHAGGCHPDQAAEYCKVLHRRDTDGLILCTFYYQPGPWLDTFIETNLPLVLFNRDFRSDVPCVIMDHRGHAMEQTARLLTAGHRRIGIMSMFQGPALERAEGFREKLRAARVYDPALEQISGYTVEEAKEAGKKLLKNAPDMTAVFCTSDSIAVGLLRAAREVGRSVPQDLSIASMDGYEYGQYTEPPLSTVRYPRPEMGRAALTLLRDIAQNKGPKPPRVVVRGATIEGSCIAPRQSK
jgi:DNA-binding LacI/PurR family transcriptional regulator